MTRSTPRSAWRVPAALLALSAVPVLAGGLRLTDLAGVTDVTPDTARFVTAPVPVVIHIVAASTYSVVGALQFSAPLRRRGWHRAAGRLLVPLGLAVALSGLWLTVLLPRLPGDGDLLAAFRLLFGSAMAASIVLGVAAIRRRDLAAHGAWMTRGYAIGLGAGTQVLTLGLGALLTGEPGGTSKAVLMAAGWVINLAVAEWSIRRRPSRQGGGMRHRSIRPSIGRGRVDPA
jgi:uncharacterized membrane protein